MRLLVLATVALALLAGPAAGQDPADAQPPTPFERADVTAVAEQLACYCGCPHMQVSTCFCGTADSIRADIAAHLDAGRSADEFIAAYIDEHGTWGLAVPPKEGFNLVVWVLPGALLALGTVLVFVLGARWARRSALAAEDEAAEPQAPGPEDSPHRAELERLLQEQD